jgi:predicted ATPase
MSYSEKVSYNDLAKLMNDPNMLSLIMAGSLGLPKVGGKTMCNPRPE